MDIRQLHYFLTLCEEMNYTRAAQRLFLSRQALRQSISALEAELCGPLFLSAHHRLTLTDRGMSLQRHAAPVVEQFQQMQAALHAEIQSAQPVRIGISVSLVPDYLPGLETQLDKFRQQYPHVEMRFRMMDNDAVADDVEQGELDAGLVIDLGCAAPVLARTTLRADPACLLVPRGHAFWDKESIPLTELRGQRVLLPSLRQDLFSPLWSACARAGFAPNAEIGPSFYQAYYLVQEQLCTCLTRYEPGARRELDRVRDVLLEDLPPLCVSMVQRRDHNSAYLDLLRSYMEQEGRGILISSHILSELADLCTSIGVINGGVMVQQGKLENIMLAIDSSNPLRITVLNQVPKALELLRQDPQVSRLSVDENKIAAWFSGSREEEAYLLQKLVDAGILVVSFAREHNSLESLFFHLTGETEQKSRNTETFGNTIG